MCDCRRDHEIQPVVSRLEEILRVPIVIIPTRSEHERYESDDSVMGNLNDVLIRESKHILCCSCVGRRAKHMLAFTFSDF